MIKLTHLFCFVWLVFFKNLKPSHCRFSYPQLLSNLWNKYSFVLYNKMGTKNPQEWVDSLVKSHKVVVFSKSYCPYCSKAKEALRKLDLKDVHVEELENHPQMDQVQDYLQKLTGARSVPRVFVNGKFYGDSSKTVADVESGAFMDHFKKGEL